MERLCLSALLISEVHCERRRRSPRSVSAAEAFAELPAGTRDPAVTGLEMVASPSEGCG